MCVFSCQRLPTKQKQNDILDVYVSPFQPWLQLGCDLSQVTCLLVVTGPHRIARHWHRLYRYVDSFTRIFWIKGFGSSTDLSVCYSVANTRTINDNGFNPVQSVKAIAKMRFSGAYKYAGVETPVPFEIIKRQMEL